jgi:DNA-binding Xre family transcriptional regulator
MKIYNRIRALLEDKGLRENRRISIRIASEESGVSEYTLKQMATGKLREVPMEVLGQLCEYLQCTPGDLLVTESELEKSEPELVAA